MKDMKDRIQVHIIREEEQSILTRAIMHHLPRQGDELRLSGGHFYTVCSIVWCLDEPDCPFTRVNIGVEAIETC